MRELRQEGNELKSEAETVPFWDYSRIPIHYKTPLNHYSFVTWRRGSESNRRIRLLQSPALPLGYPAIRVVLKLDHPNEHASLYSFRPVHFNLALNSYTKRSLR